MLYYNSGNMNKIARRESQDKCFFVGKFPLTNGLSQQFLNRQPHPPRLDTLSRQFVGFGREKYLLPVLCAGNKGKGELFSFFYIREGNKIMIKYDRQIRKMGDDRTHMCERKPWHFPQR
jgi:hypothetical protein